MERAVEDRLGSVARRRRAHAALRREDICFFDYRRYAFLIEEGNEGFARSEHRQHLSRIELRIRTERVRRRLYTFLLRRSERPESVLDLVAKLREDSARDIRRVLCAEVYADALRTYQLDDLLDLFEQRLAGVGKEKVGFVEKEHHLRFVHVADLGQCLEELRQHPEEEGGVELSVRDEVARVEYLDDAAALFVSHEPVAYVQIRLAEERIAAVHLQSHDAPRDDVERRARDLAVVSRKLRRMLADEADHRFEVLEVDEEQLVVVGYLEDYSKQIALQIVQLQYPRHQKGTDFGNSRPQLDSVLSEYVPKRYGIAVIIEIRLSQAEALDALLHVLIVLARKHHAGDVALDIGHEYRDSRVAERLGEDLQCDCFSCAGRARDEAVAVSHLRQYIDVVAGVVIGDPEKIIEIHFCSPFSDQKV